MAGTTRIPRTRGALSGLLLILLGAWGALIPFVGPYFHYAYTPDKAWAYTTGRLWLEILPGVAAALGGLIVLSSARRPLALLGAFVATLGGAWFVVGNLVSSLTNNGIPGAGIPVGTTVTRLALEELGFFTGLGVVIVFFAALALGRFAVVGVKDAALAERDGAPVAASGFAAAGSPVAAGGFAADQPFPSSPAAFPSSPAGDSFPGQDETLQPAGSDFPTAPDPSPTVTGQFPAADSQFPAADSRVTAERDPFTPAERDPFTPASESYPSATRQFPPGSSGGTTADG
jgi:hypothetical protein